MIILEPWAEIFELFPEKTLDFVGQSKIEGKFEIDFDGEHDGIEWLIIYAWASSIVEVFSEGENISSTGHIEVPDFFGPSLSEFTKSLFGINENENN